MKKEKLDLVKVDHFCMNKVKFTPASGITVNDNSSSHIGEIVNVCLELSSAGTFSTQQPYVFGTISDCFLPNCPSVELAGIFTSGVLTGLAFVIIAADGTITVIFSDGGASVSAPTVHIHAVYFAKQKCKYKKCCKK